MTGPREIAAQGCTNTTLVDTHGYGTVFLTEHGGIGMELNGRIVVKTIEAWIALAWGDLPTQPSIRAEIKAADEVGS